jgi:hypothetical protein
MNEIELSEFRAAADEIMNNPRTSDAEKRLAVAYLWTNLETDEIENAAQYKKYKEEYREIALRAGAPLPGAGPSNFAAFMDSSAGQEFFRSQDFLRWVAALGGPL